MFLKWFKFFIFIETNNIVNEFSTNLIDKNESENDENISKNENNKNEKNINNVDETLNDDDKNEEKSDFFNF